MKARIRTIKPEAFTDESLWDLEQETGLPIFRAFTGLWCHADREGRFEWRPRPLKAGILPYWDGDFSRVLDALATRGLVVKYACDGREYGFIPGFTKHQAVNAREEESKLPAPCSNTNNNKDLHASATREARVRHESSTRHVLARVERNGTEGNGRERNTRDGRDDATTPATTELENLQLPCPSNLLTPEIVDKLSSHYNVSSEAIREAEREFKTYWTVGGGMGRTFTRGIWLKKCRDRIKERNDRGELAGLGQSGSTAGIAPVTPKAAAARIASDKAFEERRLRELGVTPETAQETPPNASNLASIKALEARLG